MASLSLCAIALNEQAMLPGLLDSVRGAQFVIGVDSRSTDNTDRVARDYGATIIDIHWRDDFSYARNLTIDAASTDWILVLDADERLTASGAAAVRDVLACAPQEPADDAVTGLAFLIAQRALDGTLYGVTRSSIRLFRNRPEIRYRGIVHEEPIWLPDPSRTTSAEIDGEPHIVHYGYDAELWARGNKLERNRRLLEQRVAADPSDAYAQAKLSAHRALD